MAVGETQDITEQIYRLVSAKSSIKTAIENKGITVPDSALLGNYSTLIEQIESGGGVISGTFTPASSGIQTITHNLGRQPQGLAAMCNKDLADKVNGIYGAFGTAYGYMALLYYYTNASGSSPSSIFEFKQNVPFANINETTFQFCVFGPNLNKCMASPIVGEEYRWYVW